LTAATRSDNCRAISQPASLPAPTDLAKRRGHILDWTAMILGPTKHRATVVLATDVVGYSRLMEVDQEDTHARLKQLRAQILDPVVAEHSGRIFKNTGDGFLAAFDQAPEAARCAIAMQTGLIDEAARFPPERRIVFRMGLTAGDAIIEDGDVFGEGVNVAVRLQTYAEPGDVVMSATVAEQAADALGGMPTFDLGDLHLKNITRPVHAIGVRIGSLRNLAAPVAPRPTDTRPSIAVLPFRKLQVTPSDRNLADGIAEEIIHALAGVKELLVIARASTLRYSGRTIDAAAIGRELGVRYLLYGSVRRSGSRLRIGTELSDVENGRVILSERYEGDPSELFDLQEKIALAAMKSIAPHVREQELRRVMRKHPESLTAYDFVLRALEYLYRMDRESHAQARGLLQQAIAHDPEYALAYSYTAYWHIFRVGEGWSANPEEDAAEAARAARAALDRDGNDAMALAIFGHVQSFLLRDYQTAMAYLVRAVEVGPNSALAWTMCSITRGYLGDGPTAVERAEQGLRLAPLDGHVFWHESALAQAHYINGDYDAALAWARTSATHRPTAIFNLRLLAAILVALGRNAEAQRPAQELLRVQPAFCLALYAKRCPFEGPILNTWLERLRAAGLPE
jgi:adenylate cyclase